MRDTLAINAATASWCVTFLMSFPFTYEKTEILITRGKNNTAMMKLTKPKKPIFPALVNYRRRFQSNLRESIRHIFEIKRLVIATFNFI